MISRWLKKKKSSENKEKSELDAENLVTFQATNSINLIGLFWTVVIDTVNYPLMSRQNIILFFIEQNSTKSWNTFYTNISWF